MAGKPIRLGKAAGELNVGISTIVDFLASKGQAIDSNPNTKLDPEQYDMLRTQFAADQNLKEQSKMTAVKREKRETITLRDIKEEPKSHDDEEHFDSNATEQAKPAPAVTPKVETPKAEEKIETPEPAVEKPAEEPKPNSDSDRNQEEPTVAPPTDGGIQVIGKIDLDKLNTKTRPDKRKKEDGPIDKSDYPKSPAAPVVPEKEEVKAKETQAPEAPKEIETIRVDRTKLSGPTVLGKIELPEFEPILGSEKKFFYRNRKINKRN